MIVKLNRLERTVGVFLLIAIVGSVSMAIGLATKKGWFSRKYKYQTSLKNAEGIHAGTVVQVSGLRAGEVAKVELVSVEEVIVQFKILEKFAKRVCKDSRIQVVRPFIISEKVLDLSIGSVEGEMVPEGSMIPSVPSLGLIDLMSGKRINEFFGRFSEMVNSLRILAVAFTDEKRTEALVNTLDRIEPLVENLNSMSLSMTKMSSAFNKDKRLETLMGGLADLTREMRVILPELTQSVPNIGQQIGQLISSLTTLAKEFEKMAPAIQEVAPGLPHTSRRAVEALDETVILLKAMQRTLFLRGSVEDVRKEEAKKRQPSSEK